MIEGVGGVFMEVSDERRQGNVKRLRLVEAFLAFAERSFSL